MCNRKMKEDDIRRMVLRHLIKARFAGVTKRLADEITKPAAQINDMLANPPRKSFGSRVARELETKLHLEKFFFEDLANTGDIAPYAVAASTNDFSCAEPSCDYNQLTTDERNLIIGYRNAPEDVRQHLVRSVLEYVQTAEKSA